MEFLNVLSFFERKGGRRTLADIIDGGRCLEELSGERTSKWL